LLIVLRIHVGSVAWSKCYRRGHTAGSTKP
jgi:hypothetical protein